MRAVNLKGQRERKRKKGRKKRKKKKSYVSCDYTAKSMVPKRDGEYVP